MTLDKYGITYWTVSIGSERPSHVAVQRMVHSFVPFRIKDPPTVTRDGIDYVDCARPFYAGAISVVHPDHDLVRVEANIECAETVYLARREYLAVAWGPTYEAACESLVERVFKTDAKIAPCPLCWATRCDADFTVSKDGVVCRICGYVRSAY